MVVYLICLRIFWIVFVKKQLFPCVSFVITNMLQMKEVSLRRATTLLCWLHRAQMGWYLRAVSGESKDNMAVSSTSFPHVSQLFSLALIFWSFHPFPRHCLCPELVSLLCENHLVDVLNELNWLALNDPQITAHVHGYLIRLCTWNVLHGADIRRLYCQSIETEPLRFKVTYTWHWIHVFWMWLGFYEDSL